MTDQLEAVKLQLDRIEEKLNLLTLLLDPRVDPSNRIDPQNGRCYTLHAHLLPAEGDGP